MKFSEGLETLGMDEYPPKDADFTLYFGVFQESSVEHVELPTTLKRIEYATFTGCKKLKSIALPENLEHIGECCFYGSALRYVRLPSALKAIEDDAFRECKGLTRVDFSEGLEKIGSQAFLGSGLEDVELPASLRTVSQAAFAKCESLKTVKFGEGLETLGTDEYADNGRMTYGVFHESSLERVELPSTLKRIEYNAFGKCKNLKTIELPARLEHIGTFAFFGSGLQSVTFPKSVRAVTQGAFSCCRASGRSC